MVGTTQIKNEKCTKKSRSAEIDIDVDNKMCHASKLHKWLISQNNAAQVLK